MENNNEKVSMSQKLGILFAAIVSAIATGYVPNYINLYYTDTMGVSIGAIGLIIMITKITDGVTDIIMGMILDRTHTRFGKAKPWLLCGAAGLSLTMIMLFHCPESFSTAGKIIYCALFYFLVNPIFGTMTSVACNTLPNLVTSHSKGRTVIGVFKSFGALIPVIVIGIVVPKMLESMGENQHAYFVITMVFVIMAIISALIAFFMIKESVTERSEKTITEDQPIMEALKHLVSNKYFIYLAIGTILYNLSATPVSTYYAKYIFNNVGTASLINLPGVLMIFLLPLGIVIVNKFGKRKSMVIGLVAAALGHTLMYFANTNVGIFMIGKCVASLGAIPYFVALIPTMGEVCDYALYKTGKPMDGTISAANSMGEKIGTGLVAGLASLMLNASGYISSTASTAVTQPDSALNMIRFLMGIFPAICFILSAFCFYKIDLEKKGIEQIQQELRDKNMR